MSAPACPGCAARDLKLADLRQVLQRLQLEVRASMGKKALAVLDALDGQPGLVPAEVAKRAKVPITSARQQLIKLRARGLVRRTGWRDIPDARFPQPEFQVVGARETLNGTVAKG